MPEFNDRLTELFQRYTDNTCTREELAELSGLASADEGVFLHELMDKYYSRIKPGLSADRVDWELMFSRIVGEPVSGIIHQPAQAPVRKLGRRWWIAAAVLVLLAGIGSYYLPALKNTVKVPAKTEAVLAEQDVAPGQFRAKLTLADGKNIVLDSIATGKLAQQGSVRIIKRSGQLIYADEKGGNNELLYNTISTGRGETYSFVLADGTKIWLDAASSISFPAAFKGAERVVELVTGQAYFEVTANAAKPFSVRQGKTVIQVLGTHFNVNAHKEEEDVKVSLLEGSIRVRMTDERQVKLLQAGQQARITEDQIQVTAGLDEDHVMAWKNGFFSFRDTDLKTLMGEISRWYAIDISYEGKPSDIKTTGKAPRSISLATMLKLLQLSGIKYRIEGKRLIVAS